MTQFLGFTPAQASKMLQQKGLRANSREGAEYLIGMQSKAQDMLKEKGYQYGGQVGGFDDKSSKLFDAAVKRTSSTEPKSPEVQRYIDNVIETRGRPTMVYPTTADPLMGYDNGGDVSKDLMRDNEVKRSLLVERVKANVDFGTDKSTYDLIEKIPFLGKIAEDYYLKLLANELDSKVGRQDMPFSNRLFLAGKDPQADNELYKELLSYADERMPQGQQEPKEETPLYRKRMKEDEGEVTRKNKELMQGQSEEQRLYDQSTKEIERQRELERQEFNERRRREFMDRQGKPEFQEGGDVGGQRQGILEGGPPPAPAGFRYEPSPRGGYLLVPVGQTVEDFMMGKPAFAPLKEGDIGFASVNRGTPNLGSKNDNVVNPFPTTGATGTAPRDKARDNLNKAQAELAAERQNLANLQQELAKLPTDQASDAKRQELVEKITGMGVTLTQKEAAVSSASQSFQSVGIPTAAEAVGTTVSAPDDIVTRQQVNLMPTDDVSIKDQLLTTGTGELEDRTDADVREGTADTVADPTKPTTVTKTASNVAQDIRDEALKTTTGTLSPDAEAKAQIIKTEDLNIRDVEAATDTNNVQVESPAKRKLEVGELVSGVANAEVAKNFLEGVEAATGAPSNQATVQGQLTSLMTQFEGGDPPPWAAGAMRQATAVMAQRGLAASSMAGQAIVQAAMESALPIAMQDAKTVAQFEAQNLSNRQQRAMLAAQQRAQFLGMEFDQGFQARVRNAATISDIANRNFSSEVQIELENARLAQTTDMTVLGNKQALVMAKSAAIAQADMANLNNRQQAEVRNAQAFLQMDMANFNAEQQVDMFSNQSIIQGLFTDIASENAMKQFNATSENQANQFFVKLETQVDEFNSAQTNAMEQFNAGEDNALTKFQEELNNQRDMFNARNELVIAQANAQWRQQLTTVNTAAQNEANRQDALQANALTQKGLDEIWQRERDLMSYAFASAENAETRRVELLKAELSADGAADTAYSSALGNFAGAVVNGIFGYYGDKAAATIRAGTG